MTPRAREVLHEIVETYIETGEPVSSRTISHSHRDPLSAASIRNIMADLTEEGYLSQPHTSAGRIPTPQAFRSYIQSLTLRKMAGDELDRLRTEYDGLDSVEARVERTSRILTEMTRSVGIAATIPQASPALDQIELVGLPDNRVLMVVVTRDSQIRNRVLMLDTPLTSDELASVRNYINRNFSGWTLEAVRRELAARLEHASAAYDEIFQRMTQLYSKGLMDIGTRPEVHMEGASYLVGLDLHLTKEKMRELLRSLEEKKRVLELLDRFLEHPVGEVAVHVGLGETHPSMRELSLVGLPVVLPNGISAVIAVLGPMRMNYSRAMNAVQRVGQAFQGGDNSSS